MTRRVATGSRVSAQHQTRPSTCPHCGMTKIVVNGGYLRTRREAHKRSLRSVARTAKLSAAFLSDVENNRRNASERALMAYVHAGVIDADELRLA